MPVQHFLDESDLASDAPDARPPLRVVIAYDDLAAGKRAMRVITHLGKGLGNDLEFELFPWSFDLLTHLDWGEVATRDAINADILIIATSSAGPLPPAVGRWTQAAINRKRGTAAAVFALFGSQEISDEASSSRLETIQTAAERAGLDFFAPPPPQDIDEVIAGIHRRAELVTPVLFDVLHHHDPTPRWGINE